MNYYYDDEMPNDRVETISHCFSNCYFGRTAYVTVIRNGDIVNNYIVSITLPELPENYKYINNVENKIIEKITLLCGGQIIQFFDEDFLYATMNKAVKTGNNVYLKIPINISTNISSFGLPLIAMYFHEVRLECTLKHLFEIVTIKENKNEIKICEKNNQWTHAMFSGQKKEEFEKIKAPDMELTMDYKYINNNLRNYYINRGHELVLEKMETIKHQVRPSEYFEKQETITAAKIILSKKLYNDAVKLITSFIDEQKFNIIDTTIDISFEESCKELFLFVSETFKNIDIQNTSFIEKKYHKCIECVKLISIKNQQKSTIFEYNKDQLYYIHPKNHNKNIEKEIAYIPLDYSQIKDKTKFKMEIKLKVGKSKNDQYMISIYTIIDQKARIAGGMMGLVN